MGKFIASVTDEDHVLVKLEGTVHDLDREMRETVQELGDETEVIYSGFALKRSGRMARGVKAIHIGGSNVLVKVHARNPQSGYDYVGVTRFGHQLAVITPSGSRRPASVIATRRRRSRLHFLSGPPPALRLPSGQYRYSVRGFHPAGDWAMRAWPHVKAAGFTAARKLGAKILARF